MNTQNAVFQSNPIFGEKTKQKVKKKRKGKKRTDSPTLSELEEEIEELLAREKEEKRRKESLAKKGPPKPVTSDNEYDTDCEVDRSITPYDVHGQKRYILTCKKLKIEPIKHVLKSIVTSKMILKNRCLLENDILAISNALVENTTITVLCLDGNKFTSKAASYLSMGLQDNTSVKFLSLKNCNLGNGGAVHLCSMLSVNILMRQICLSGNDFGDKDAEHFALVLNENRLLQTIELDNNKFGKVAGEILGPALGNNETLQTLNLSWNHFRKSSAVALCKGLQENVFLKSINLSMNGLGSEGAEIIAKVLSDNGVLTEMDISSNRLHDSDAFVIAKGLRQNEALKTLKIGKNPITTVGATALVTALRDNENSCLEVLNMSSIHLHQEVLKHIEELQQNRKKFCFLHGPILDCLQKDTSKYNQSLVSGSPLLTLKMFMASRGIKLIDIFERLDVGDAESVTHEDFRDGIKEIKAPLNDYQINDLLKLMDPCGTGVLNFEELEEDLVF